jgi:hypothetical protein
MVDFSVYTLTFLSAFCVKQVVKETFYERRRIVSETFSRGDVLYGEFCMCAQFSNNSDNKRHP